VKAIGSQLLTHLLKKAGIDVVSGIPGHTVFPFANAVGAEPGLRPLLVRNEAVSAFAADAYFRVSGRMMAVFGHSLPGVANMAAGIGNAYADSSAMLIVAGETATEASGRGAYQELARSTDKDMPQLLRHITKRSWQPQTPTQLVEHTLRALKVATSGRPGPVALHVPQEIWEQEAEIPDWPSVDGFLIGNAYRPDANAIERAAALLERAERPLILAGNGVNLARAQGALVELAEMLDAPVATTVTGKGAFPENHPLAVGVIGWVGTACANWAGQNADLVLAIGSRMTEGTTSSWQPGVSLAVPDCALIQCDVEPTEIANVFPVDVALIGDARLTILDLCAALNGPQSHQSWCDAVRAEREGWLAAVAEAAAVTGGEPLPVAPVVAALREVAGEQPLAIVCDVGKHAKWIAQQFEARAGDIVVSSMGAGTMGIGTCGAVGVALGAPNHKAIAWVGDGGLSMTSFVLPTVAEYRLPVIYVVIDDQSFGEVANLQEMRFGKTIFSEFTANGANPDYRFDIAALASVAGIPNRKVSKPDEVTSAFEWAFAQDGPVLLDVLVDRRSRVPAAGGSKLTDIWNHPISPWATTRGAAGDQLASAKIATR
jgi:acetolactate synthase I/II/III large subunit